MSFSFDPKQAWAVNTSSLLPRGNYVCEILEINAKKLSSGGYPMIELKVGNDQGEIRDWLVISSAATFGKFTQLVLSCGVPEDGYPKPGEDFDTTDGRVEQRYAAKLQGCKVGVVVREEEDSRNPGRMRSAVAGYCLPTEITSDMPADTRGLPNGGAQVGHAAVGSSQKDGEPDIPFLHDGFELDFDLFHAHANR
jgi:hypothetical protein